MLTGGIAGWRRSIPTRIAVVLDRLKAPTVGAENLFDEYPDELNVAADGTPLTVPGLITGGNFSYPWEASPFGINGRFMYARFNYSF